MSIKQNQPVRATVKKIISQEPVSDSYAVAYPIRDYGELRVDNAVTFQLNGRKFRRGQVVELQNVCLFEHGWRADSASPVTATSQ